MSLVLAKPASFRDAGQAFDALTARLQEHGSLDPSGKLSLSQSGDVLTVHAARGDFFTPERTIHVRPDSVTGFSGRDPMDRGEALRYLGEFAERWDRAFDREPSLDPAFTNSCQEELRLRAKQQEPRGTHEPPPLFDGPEAAWQSLSRLLEGPQSLSAGGGPSGDDGTKVSICYAGDRTNDILVTNVVRTGGAYRDEIQDPQVRLTMGGGISYWSPATGEVTGEFALRELDRMVRLLLEKSY